MLHFDSVHLTYRAASGPVSALADVSLSIAPGEFVVLLGENGSGKSSLVRMANGLLLPDAGSVAVDGLMTSDPAHTRGIRERVGMVFQRPDDQIVATSVEDDIAFGPENLGLTRAEIRERVDSAMDACGLRGLESREPHLLSGGQRQRLAIAGALAMKPRYLVLDEPASMLDSEARVEVLRVILGMRDSGTGILLVTHDLADVAHADKVVVLHEGRVVHSGAPAGLLGGAVSADWGLEVPPIVELAGRLRSAGLSVPVGAMDATGIGAALWH